MGRGENFSGIECTMVNSVIPESLWDPRGLAGENIFMRTSVLDSPDDERVADEIGSARVILYDSITFPERLLERLPALEILIRTGDGHDAIDMGCGHAVGDCVHKPARYLEPRCGALCLHGGAAAGAAGAGAW